MTKLEKSIRRELKHYGPYIRSGYYDSNGRINKVCCDVENGIVTDVRLYTYGQAMERRDYYRESIDITWPLSNYGGSRIQTWDDAIREILTIVREEVSPE